MPSLQAEEFNTILRQASLAKERLVLALGPTGSGKTALLRAISDSHSLSYISVGPDIATALANISARQRSLGLSRILSGLLPPGDSGLALDNLDLLFLPELKCDPLRLVAQLSQHRLVIASFTGQFASGRYIHAYPDHPEYISRPLSGLTVALLSAGIPSFYQT